MSSLEDRISSIESRLADIEDKLNIRPQVSRAVEQPQPDKTIQPRSKAITPASSGTISYGNWLGIIAILCFVLAAGFIIKLSIDTGWLTPMRQVGLAVLFGFSLIGVGLRLARFDVEYASLLPGAGIIVLYMSVFAAHKIYPLISFEMAILFTCFISAICIYLYSIIRHDLYPLVASIGAYTTPVLLSGDMQSVSLFTLYYFVPCSLAFTFISIWLSTRTLLLVSAYLAILLTGSLASDLHVDNIVAGLLAVHFIIFSVGTFFYTRISGKPLTETESWCFFPVLLVFYAFEYRYLDAAFPGYASWYSLEFAALLLILYAVANKFTNTKPKDSGIMIFTFVSIVCFHSGYIELMPSAMGPWLLVFILLMASQVMTMQVNKSAVRNYLPFIALFAVIVCCEYLRMLANLFDDPIASIQWPAIFMTAAAIWVLFIRSVAQANEFNYALLGAAHLLVVTAFYRLGDPHGSLAVSALWLLYAIIVIAFAFVRKDRVMANSALIVLSFAAAKALLYDAASAPTIVRILCLVSTGVVLYGAGFMYRKITTW